MPTTVAVYDSHKEAAHAIDALGKAGFPNKQLSLLGKADVVDEHVHLRTREDKAIATPVTMGAVIGPVVGALAGIGLFAIPGFGFIYGAGAVVGAFAGFDFGVISGAIVSVLVALGIKKDVAEKYQEELEKGNFLVVVQGNDEEVERADSILEKEGSLLEMETY